MAPGGQFRSLQLATIHHSRPTLILLLDVFLQRPRADFRPIHIPLSVGRDAFGRARSGFVGILFRVGNESDGLAVSGAPDTDAALPARVSPRIRLRVSHINNVVFINENPARTAELSPFFEEFSVLVENLDAIIIPIADEEPAFRIQSDGVRRVELAWARSFLTPRLDELPVLREFHDPSVRIPAMSVRDEDVAIGRGDDIRWLIESVRPVAGDSSLAERHQDLSARTELDDDVASPGRPLGRGAGWDSVGHPDVSISVHIDAVREYEH